MSSSVRAWRRFAIVATTVLGSACAHHLSLKDFRGQTLAVVYLFPSRPEVLTGSFTTPNTSDPVGALLKTGTRIVKEVEARSLRKRLDSAATRVNVSSIVAERASGRAARFLGTRLIEDENVADYILEVRIGGYGVDAKDWNSAAHYFVDANVVLLSGRSRKSVWSTEVRARDPISPEVIGRSAVRNVVTAAAMSDLSVDILARALEELAKYTADHVTEELRHALKD